MLFDYLPPSDTTAQSIAPGSRVAVAFGRRRQVGIVIGASEDSDIDPERLKRVRLLDAKPLLNAELLSTLQWLSRYYLHPLGEVIEAALPASLRRPRALPEEGESALMLAVGAEPGTIRSGTASAKLAQLLADGPLTTAQLDKAFAQWRGAAAHLRRRGLVVATRIKSTESTPSIRLVAPPLTGAQRAAIESVASQFDKFSACLLDGVTGSGKTEVYLALSEQALVRNRQVLVLVPEIGLTPQLVRRFRDRLPAPVYVMHSNLADGERTRAWLAATKGGAGVFIGTRSAVFTPLPDAGLIVVDEEHDASYKQQDSIRYHARDAALVRARALGVPVVLGSATPALETLANVDAGRYQHLHLPSRPGAARAPDLRCIDLRGKPLRDGLAAPLISAIRDCLARGEQALVFRNRRGFAPLLMCRGCGWHATCERCDKPLTWHRGAMRLRCHHCGVESRVPDQCPHCGQPELAPIGLGTERMEQALRNLFPDAMIVRIDRETVRGRNTVDDLLGRLAPDQPGIYVGTQMLAKGHDLPNLTTVGLVGVDDGLFSIDFRAGERLAQLVVQVAGRAGRALKPGTVWLQTHEPDHPLLRELIKRGYAHLARILLSERRSAGLPPYAHLALLRAQASTLTRVEEFLGDAVRVAEPPSDVNLLGPMPAPMPRRAGMHRGQLLLSAEQRSALHRFLEAWLSRVRELASTRQVRWSIDVDPLDLY